MQRSGTFRFALATACALVATNLAGCLGDPPEGILNNHLKVPRPDAGLEASVGNGGGGNGGSAGNTGGVGGVTKDGGAGGRVALDGSTDGGDASTCKAGGACSPSACEIGVFACHGDTQVCTKTDDVRNGTTCTLDDGGSGVCNVGVCAPCSNGTDCTSTGSCSRMTIACNSGGPVCTAAGTLADGADCGTNEYCNGGKCTACIAGSSCVPDSNVCNAGKATCTLGKLGCNDQHVPATDGTPCGDNQVCTKGVCVPCEANVVCTPTNACHTGLTSCSTGTSVCVDTGNAVPDNSACTGTDKCATAYACVAGSCKGFTSVTCGASDQCHVAGTCNPTTGKCSNPPAADKTVCNDGNLCTTGDICQGGSCVPVSGVACKSSPSGSCVNSGVCDPSTGKCVSTNKADGSACGVANSGMTCTAGSCACDASETACSNICVDEHTDSSNCGSCGNACTTPKTVCVNSGCACPAAQSTFCPLSNTCVNTSADKLNCGACGHSCLGSACIGGYCQATTIGSTPSGQGMQLAVGPSSVFFSDGPLAAGGGHLLSCPLAGCGGAAPTIYETLPPSSGYASAVAYDPTTKLAYLGDQNQGTAYILSAPNVATTVGVGTPQEFALDAKYLYIASYSGITKVDKTGLGLSTALWNSSLGAVKGVAVDASTGNIWGVDSLEVADISADGAALSVWPEANMADVSIIKGVPYLVATDGIYMCPSASNCTSSSLTLFYSVSYTNHITYDASYVYFSNSSAGIYKCAIGGCGQKPTQVTSAGGYAADITNDSQYIYWITGAGAVQRVPK